MEGVLTLLHEYSHIVLPEASKKYAYKLFGGVRNKDDIDEFFADLGMSRIASKMRINKRIIYNHLLGRIGAHSGVPILLEMAKGKDERRDAKRLLEKHRNLEMPRERKPTPRRGFFEMPKRRRGFFERPEGPSLFRGIRERKYRPFFRR